MIPHILLIEDDKKTRMMLAHRLQHAGYAVTQAENGETAIDLLEQETFDVVVSDIILGDVDGIEVLQTARHQSYQPQVILLTGYGSLETSLVALREGAYDYLLKPCSAERLLTCVEGALKRHLAEIHLREAITTLIPNQGMYETFQSSPRPPAPPQREKGSPQRQDTMPLCIGALSIGSTRHEVFFHEQPVRLTPIEYSLLRYLAERTGKVCRCNDIVQYTHGMTTNNSDAQAILRSHIRNLRKKISSSYIVNDRATGYMLLNPEEPE
jgi:DNA-binding response OmpR family regulator